MAHLVVGLHLGQLHVEVSLGYFACVFSQFADGPQLGAYDQEEGYGDDDDQQYKHQGHVGGQMVGFSHDLGLGNHEAD